MMTEVIDLTPDGQYGRLHDELVQLVTEIEFLMLNLHDVEGIPLDRKLMGLRHACNDIEALIYLKVSEKAPFEKLHRELEACRDGIRDVYRYVKRIV